MAYVTSTEVANFLRIGPLIEPNPTNDPPIEGTSPKPSEVDLLIGMAQSKLDSLLHTSYEKNTTTEIYEAYLFDNNVSLYSINPLNQPLIQFDSNNSIQKWENQTFVNVDSKDYLIEPETNTIFVRQRGRYKITYSYGFNIVPPQIKRIMCKMVGIDLFANSSGFSNLPISNDPEMLNNLITRWTEENEKEVKSLARFNVI